MNLVLIFILPLVLSATEKDDSAYDSLSTDSKSRFAMLDDVRILANGLLQLGHGLKDFVHKTKGQINEIFQKLNIFDKSVTDLSEQTNEIREKEEELKDTTSKLQENNEELKNISRKINSQVENLLQDKIHLQAKVGSLEEKLFQMTQGTTEGQEIKEISSLKNFVEQQDVNIRHLLKVVQEQHMQLDHQNVQIKDLEDKLSKADLQESVKSVLAVRRSRTGFLNLSNSTDGMVEQNDSRDCNDIYNRGERSSGIYTIRPNGSTAFDVYCEITSESANTVIQRRTDGSVDFNQTWETYLNGFGELTGEFWLGLEKIHAISQQADYILHIELQDWKENWRFVEYMFTLGNQDTSYALQLTQVSGNIPSALPEQREILFSTSDQNSGDLKCPAETFSGGWWNTACSGTNLNGKYIKQRPRTKLDRRRGQGIYWKSEKGRLYSLKSTKIMLYRTDLDSFE
ncbi:angiopoietin-related protein 3 precursor [Xenopus tropicalis]|uniref:Angiopoietin-related protein 3 precursor n=1 Tax=Xenopus tropicalis TaxID=8364 RepID=A0A803KLC1_XENTR|eukprot:NP_001011408.1 angiopoietin-related protein 3 precursor [Xenopus tropicalis]